MKRNGIGALACAAVLAAAAPAGAAIVPGVAVDSSNGIDNALPRVDVAPDGTTALVYLKVMDGEPHPFVARFVNGAWTAPQQVDPGSDDTAEAPRIAVANGGKVVVTARSATITKAWISPSAGAPFGAPQTIQAAGRYGNVDLAPAGNGYLVSSDLNDMVAWRLEGTSWTQVGAGPLDAVATDAAGDPNNNEARVATAPDGGSAVIAWGEVVTGAGTETFARRLTGTAPGPAAGAHLESLPGADPYPAMTFPVADQPDVGMSADGAAWVVFRQDFRYGATGKNRAIVRPFAGNAFGPYQLADGMPEPPTEGRDYQRIDVNAAGQGLITHYGNLTNPFELATLAGGVWTKGALVEPAVNDAAPLGSPGLGENGSGLVGYAFRPDGTLISEARGRTTLGGLGPVLTLSNPALGELFGGVEVASGSGAFAVAVFLQIQGMVNRHVSAAVVDLPQPPAGPQPGGDTTRPVVSRLRLSRKRFRLGRALAQVAAVGTGTRIRFNLSEAATVSVTFRRAVAGRRVGGRCVRRTRRNRGRRACTRLMAVRGRLRVTAPSGARSIRFSGRLSRRRSLTPAAYQLRLVARDAAGNASTARTARFRLLKRKPRRR